MHISANPIKKGQKSYLNSGKGIQNKTQARKDIMSQFDKSVRTIHHVLEKTKYLKKMEIYDKINASSFHKILENSLKEIEYLTEQKNFVYDVRTAELARLLFETSSKYISSSPHFSDGRFLKEELEKTSQSFRTLSKSVLQQHAYEKLPKEKEEKYKKELRNTELEIQETINGNKRLQSIQNEIENSTEKKIELEQHNESMLKTMKSLTGFDKSGNRTIMECKGQIGLNDFKIKGFNKKIKIAENELINNKKLSELFKRKKYYGKLLLKFDDLQDYFCPIKPLDEFRQK